MKEIDGNWIMEGLDRKDPKCIKNHNQLTDYINEVGFLPLFKNSIIGFSVEEISASDAWFSGSELDAWNWRELIATEGKVAYGKLFRNKAGFVSREWYPYLVSYRRDGYDFDSRYEDGLASRRAKNVMDILMKMEEYPSNELKAAAGFGKGKEKGFEGTITQLQMQTYITVRGFHRKKNKKNEEYGWPISSYTVSENLFGEDYVRSQYNLSAKEARDKIISKIKSVFPSASEQEIEYNIR